MWNNTGCRHATVTFININNPLDIKEMLNLIKTDVGEKPDAELEKTDAEDMGEDEGDKSIDSEKTENNPGNHWQIAQCYLKLSFHFFL